MRVSGFTIVRNGVRFAYPFEESIRSLGGVEGPRKKASSYDRVR